MSVETEETIRLQKSFRYVFPIKKDAIDEEQRFIRGYGTTEAVDREGQIIAKSAVENALKDYLVNPTLRADHRPPPIGQTLVAKVDQKGLVVEAQVFKGTQAAEEAWTLINQGGYRAFSIGGAVLPGGTERVYNKDTRQHVTRVTKLLISEISVTDAPANPECFFEVIQKTIAEPADETSFQPWMFDVLLIKEQFPMKTPPGGGKPSRFEGCVQQMMRTKGISRERAAKLCAYIGRRAGKIKELETEVEKTMSETETQTEPQEPQEPTEPTVEDRLAALEKQLADLVAKLEKSEAPEEERGEAEADLDPKMVKAVTAEVSKALGLKIEPTAVRTAHQESPPIGDQPPAEDEELTLSKMVQISKGLPDEEVS